ncbi:choice-of-anchor A family protein [Cellulosimicrobium cellulans]|uniref:collagen-binding domain-containing protein n=1 Tax=Cellulosimicrobium cellulans TaxID=1710 RepID=UPI0019644C98|nr:collagen-binding domain-containing protein [Cellulosimicrobium cellulans]MBN0040538.1 choice-of-anchor A family protein [Cellulosimicrobium cellulans]
MLSANKLLRATTIRRAAAILVAGGLSVTGVVLPVTSAGAVGATVNPFDLAGGFSVYAREDAHLDNHETEGSVAVGGELTVRAEGGTYPIVHQVAGTADYTIPTVDGDPTRLLVGSYAATSGLTQITNAGVPAGSGAELEGYLKVVGDDPAFGTHQRADWVRYRTAVDEAPAIDATNQKWPDGAATVATERDSVAAYVEAGATEPAEVRQCLADLVPSGAAHVLTVAEDAGDRVVLSALEPGRPNVVEYAAIADAYTVQFADGVLPSADTPLIVSVPAGTTELRGSVFGAEGAAARYVLWDLSQLDGPVTLGTGGTRLDGSVYAPTADLTVEAAPLDGQVVARNLTLLGGEAHAYLFAGSIPCATEPVVETGSLTVTKVVAGAAASTVPAGTTFTVAYDADGTTGELAVPVGGSATVDALPLGTEVVLSEPTFPAVDGVEWGEPTWQVDGAAVEPGDDGTVRVEIGATADVAVVLTNTADVPVEPTPTPSTPTPTEPVTPDTPGTPGTPDAPTAPADSGSGGLATTGVQAWGIALAAAVLVALGVTVLVLRRRQDA